MSLLTTNVSVSCLLLNNIKHILCIVSFGTPYRDVRNSKLRKQDMFSRHWSQHLIRRTYKRSTGPVVLKLYCRYLYTRPYMINRIWSLKQLWLQVNGHAWFHLHGLRWPVRNGEGTKNSKWKYMFPAGFEPAPRQSMTGKSERLRPLGHAG